MTGTLPGTAGFQPALEFGSFTRAKKKGLILR